MTGQQLPCNNYLSTSKDYLRSENTLRSRKSKCNNYHPPRTIHRILSNS